VTSIIFGTIALFLEGVWGALVVGLSARGVFAALLYNRWTIHQAPDLIMPIGAKGIWQGL